MSKKNNNRKGFEFLESDTELYNLLITKQDEGDEILQIFNIQLINEDYTTRDTQEVNTIYILRDTSKSESMPTSFSGDGYITRIQCIISCSQYDTIKASALLKTTTKTINNYLKQEALTSYMKLDSITPHYSSPGRLSEYVLEFKAYEINEYKYISNLNKELKLNLCVSAEIIGTDKPSFHKVFPLHTVKSKKIKTNNMNKKLSDNEFVGG